MQRSLPARFRIFGATIAERSLRIRSRRRIPLRTRWIVLIFVAVFFGALGGTLFAPQPAGAVSKEMIELQQQVTRFCRGSRICAARWTATTPRSERSCSSRSIPSTS